MVMLSETKAYVVRGLIIILLLLIPVQLYALPSVRNVFPKRMNYYLAWTLTEAQARELSRWDVVILDMENQQRNPDLLRLMRTLNPDIVIVAYIAPVEVRTDTFSFPPNVNPLRRQFLSGVQSLWYLTDTQGIRKSWWPGTQILNITAPEVRSYVVRFVDTTLMNSGLWDGVMYDNGWDTITYFAGSGLDLNRDGQAESGADADTQWRTALTDLYTTTRFTLGSRGIVLLNDGPRYASSVQGVQIENFAQQGWLADMREYRDSLAKGILPQYTGINANTGNKGNQHDYKAMRYGLASALLFDGYYGFTFGDREHNQLWWYDEYDIFLGQPVGNAQEIKSGQKTLTPGVWRRDFERGIVLVNSTSEPYAASFDEEYERVTGTQDIVVNSGAIDTTFEIPPGDGILLVRPLQTLTRAVYENGVFARVFTGWGTKLRTGFFAYSASVKTASIIASFSDTGGEERLLVARDGEIRIMDDAGSVRAQWRPFDGYRGALEIAVGGDDTGRKVVAVAQRVGGAQVKTYSPEGTLLNSFIPYGKDYRGGVSVAVGDVTGDGRDEVVTGALTGGPHVRIFSQSGRLLSPGFFAYGASSKNGVRVAVGDVNGDGVADIVTGQGVGGSSLVKVFTQGGKEQIPAFFAYGSESKRGVTPVIADVDGDGKGEILATSSNLFSTTGIQ